MSRYLIVAAAAFVAALFSPTNDTAQVRGSVVRPAPVPPPRPAATTPARPITPPAVPTRPPVVQSPVVRIPSVTAVKPSTPTPSTVNGNSAARNTPQQRYGVFRTNTQTGKTSLHKVGVSGGGTRSGSSLPNPRATLNPAREYSNRARVQTNQLNRTATENGRYTYNSRILEKVPPQPSGSPTARQTVLAGERQTVTKVEAKLGSRPPGNKLPKSYQFSPLKK